MRILWHSNHPGVKSGYGRQTADWVPRLADLGHEIAISGFHGTSGFMDSWTAGNGATFPVYPAGNVPYANDVVGLHARHWRADLVISLMDAWVLDTTTLQYPSPRIPLACWMPVDTSRSGGKPWLGEYDHRRLNDSRAFPIAMTRFGEQALADADFTPFYVPHGVDCDVYQPGDRMAIRESMGVQDRFVIVINSANRDKTRKAFPEQIEAFRRFHGRHADALLIIHAEEDNRLGLNLRQMIDRMGIGSAVRFSSQYMIAAGLIPETQLAGTYCAADLVSQAAFAEGFGLPIAEAEACFPATTPVSATGIVRTMQRRYSGELIRVETAAGSVEATSNHPFWTNRGWVPAGELRLDDCLFYNGGYAETGVLRVHSGRIGDLVGSVRSDADDRGRAADGENVRRRALAGSYPWSPQTTFGAESPSPGNGDPAAVGLYGGNGRWRRLGVDQEIQRAMEACRAGVKHGLAADGMAGRHVLRALDVHRPPHSDQRGAVLRVHHSGPVQPADLLIARTATRYQASADGVRDRILPGPVGAGSPHGADRPADGDGPYRAAPEYQAIRSIERRSVENFPVYNLTTLSGTYCAGPGFLVHNCGTPTVVTQGSAMPEVAGPGGFVVRGEPFWAQGHDAWWMKPSIPELVRVYEKAYNGGAAYQAKKAAARPHILASYELGHVLTSFWEPVLKKIEAAL